MNNLKLKFVLFLSTIGILLSDSGTIRGNIKDSNGNPIPDVRIYIESIYLETLTDNDGNYILLDVPEGAHDVTTYKNGYNKVTFIDILISADKTKWMNFTLQIDEEADLYRGENALYNNSHKGFSPSGVYLWISKDYEFEQVLIFNENSEVQVFEKNHSVDNKSDSPDLLESYKLYWKIQDNKLCFPLKVYPSENVKERYCQDYYIDEDYLIFFEPGRGDEVEEIRFIKLTD